MANYSTPKSWLLSLCLKTFNEGEHAVAESRMFQYWTAVTVRKFFLMNSSSSPLLCFLLSLFGKEERDSNSNINLLSKLCPLPASILGSGNVFPQFNSLNTDFQKPFLHCNAPIIFYKHSSHHVLHTPVCLVTAPFQL